MPRQTVFDMSFAKACFALVSKAECKSRTRDEVDEVTYCSWQPNL